MDVFFRKPVLLVDWGTPLPEAHGMSFDMQDMFPYNAGVALMNIPYLRQTNADFIAWLLKQRNGLYFGPSERGCSFALLDHHCRLGWAAALIYITRCSLLLLHPLPPCSVRAAGPGRD